jgi:hypothetical protein
MEPRSTPQNVIAAGQRIRLWTPAEMEQLPPVQWLVEGVLPTSALAEVHGPPESGKTFLMLDLALSVASGVPWHGRRVRPGPVVYIAAERFRGLERRVRAWMTARGAAQRPDILIGDGPLQLLDGESVGGFLGDLEQLPRRPALIVLDTLSGCMLGGDENSSKDMGRAVNSLLTLREATGATVVVIHHTTKKGGPERGHGLLRGRMDVMMSAIRQDDTLRVSCSKMNDHEHFAAIRLRLRAAAASCVLAESPTPDRAGASPRGDTSAADQESSLSDGARSALLALSEKEMAVTRKEWLQLSKCPEASLDRHAANLRERGYIDRAGKGLYRITQSGKDLLGS